MRRFSIRKIVKFLHLWLGLISGIIISVVAITGCIYAFEPEIRALTQPYQYVEQQSQPFLSPSALKEKAEPYVYVTLADSANSIYGVTYGSDGSAAKVAYNDVANGYCVLFINPYTGVYLGKMIYENDFFRFILSGHRNLWLPYAIGHQIVGWAVIVFVVIIVTGIILFIPKQLNRKSLKATLTIKARLNKQRRNYDLHRVLGGYAALFSLILALTGLTWSFNWYGNAYYGLFSGGNELKRWEVPASDTSIIVSHDILLADSLWHFSQNEYPIGKQGIFMFDFPQGDAGTYRISFNPDDKTYYESQSRFFDKNNLSELAGGGIYGIDPKLASKADLFYRMTYDIHVGSIGGLVGRILVFATSLIVATLPFTGFFIYRSKNKKCSKRKSKPF